MSVKEYLLKGEKEERFLIKDVADHGCSGGTISELIYYEDCNKFYDKHHEEIWDEVTELIYYDDTEKFHDEHEDEIWSEIQYACDCTGEYPLQWVQHLNGGKDVDSIKTLKNLLSWWICEVKAQEIVYQDREQKTA